MNARPSIGRTRHSQPVTAARSTANETHLRAQDGSQGDELSGAVAPTVKIGETYTFIAERVLPATVGGHELELHSELSPAVTLTMRDTFPPRSPSGLATVPSVAPERSDALETRTPPDSAPKAYIDLSWEPNTEPDLAGYYVYRRLARPNGDPQGSLARLTATPISAPAYRDVAVTPGQRYIYSVSAVDASGNESAPSAQAQEVVPSPK